MYNRHKIISYNNNEIGGSFITDSIENLISPLRYVKKFSKNLNNLRYNKKTSNVLENDKFLAQISKDVYNNKDNRKESGYIRNLSNDEIAVYNNNGLFDVAIRGTINKMILKLIIIYL